MKSQHIKETGGKCCWDQHDWIGVLLQRPVPQVSASDRSSSLSLGLELFLHGRAHPVLLQPEEIQN